MQSRALDQLLSSTLDANLSRILDMTTMGERLKLALEARGLEPKDLIAKTKISRAGIYFILDDTTTPAKIRAATVTAICKSLRISKDWFLQGKGDMDAKPDIDADEWSDVQGYAQSLGLGTGAEADEYAETHKLKFKASSLRNKGLQPDNLHIFYGKGDSMMPRIRPGDAVLFDISDTRPVDGAIYVIFWKKEYYAKRAMVLDDSVYFTTDNPEGDHYWNKPRRMDAKRDPIEITGRVRWIGSWEG